MVPGVTAEDVLDAILTHRLFTDYEYGLHVTVQELREELEDLFELVTMYYSTEDDVKSLKYADLVFVNH